MKYEYGMIPPVGVHEGIPAEMYFSWKALNHSTLKEVDKSPAHYFYKATSGESNDTPAKLFGTAAHAMLLEPARFRDSLMLGPINPTTGRCYGTDSKKWEEFAKANPGMTIVSQESIESLRMIADNIEANPDTKALITGEGRNELTIVWKCPVTGLLCKGRIDRYRSDFGRIDLKTAASAEPSSFARKGVCDYGYHTQDDWYRRGVEVLGMGKSNGVLVVVESEPPYLPVVVEWCEETRKLAGVQNMGRLLKIRECMERNEWPGYPGGIQTLSAPTWEFQRFGMGF